MMGGIRFNASIATRWRLGIFNRWTEIESPENGEEHLAQQAIVIAQEVGTAIHHALHERC